MHNHTQEGINVLYSGELGEIRHSTFYKLRRDFSEKSSFSLKYVFSGQENYAFERKQICLESGQALFLKDEKSYQCAIDFPTATSGLCIDLNFDQLSNVITDPLIEKEMFFFDPYFSTQRISFLDPSMHLALNRVVRENIEENPVYFEEFMNDLMIEIMDMEAGYAQQIQSVPAKKIAYQKELFKRLLIAKNYIYDQRYNSISLQDIAKASHLSSFYLHRLFSKVFGYTPSSYLEQLRMHEAQKELQKGLAVKEVCFTVGYSDESYFCRRFKKYFGKTPKQYQLDTSN